MTTTEEAEQEHKVRTGVTYGPRTPTGRPSNQYYGRCSCGWVHVAVTFDSLTPYIHGHLEQVKTP
jgi:hypothetical protein